MALTLKSSNIKNRILFGADLFLQNCFKTEKSLIVKKKNPHIEE